MKNKLFILLKMQFMGSFGINKLLHGKRKGQAVGFGMAIAAVLALFALFEGIACLYAWLFAFGLAEADVANAGSLYMGLVFLLTSFILFVFSLANVNGKVFGFRDYEMTVSLPVETWQIAVSKIAFLYLSNIAATVAIMVPFWIFGAVYLGFSSATHGAIVLLLFFAPLFPTFLAVFFGTLLAIATARMKHKAAMQTIFFLVIVVAAVIVPYLLPQGKGSGEELAAMAAVFSFAAVLFEKFWVAAAYSAVSAALFVLPCLFIGKFFTKINTLILSHKATSKYQFKEQKTASKLKAVFVKEIKRLFGCPVYAMNTICAPVMMIVFPVIILLSSETDFGAIRTLFQNQGYFGAFCLTLVSGLSTIPTTFCAISMEGKNFWILRSAPLSVRTVLTAKLLVNTVIETLPGMVITLIYGILLGVGAGYIAFAVICGALLSTACGIFGLLFNLKFPMLEWENETIPVKRGKSGIFTMLVNFAAFVVVGVSGWFLLSVMPIAALAVMMVLAVLYVLIGLFFLNGKGEDLYNKLIG